MSWTVYAALPLMATLLTAQTARPPAESYAITRSYETSQKGSDGSTGSSHGSDTIVERVIARRDGGVEVEYDLPREATRADRTRSWQYPARIFRSPARPMQLLNADELERSVGAWLRAAKWDRSVCGRWIFTWTGQRIECDPQSVVGALQAIDLTGQDLRDGAPYLDTRAATPVALVRVDNAAGPASYRATVPVDPDKVRAERAETDVALGEITREPVRLDAALRARAAERVSGTVSIRFETDDGGVARKRTRTTALTITRPDGIVETSTATETIERRPVAP